MNIATQYKDTFIAKSDVKAHDLDHKRKISFNIDRYNEAVVRGKQQFANLDAARKQAKNIKWKAIEHLDTHLEMFEKNFTEQGGKVIWAEDADEVLNAILAICRSKNTRLVVKSKSMVTEELHLNEFLEKNEIESIETDLGEYIQQLDGEPPYHIVTPAMHKSKEDIAALFHDKLGVPSNLSPSELTLIAREKLRAKYTEAEVGITGGNFLIADTGGVCITENEGNGRLTTAFPATHIAIVGIEKVLPSVNDLALFWPLLATFGTGQPLTVYNTLITGPRQGGETDGPRDMYVILLDNGRTNLLRREVRESMYCIRCGSCLNACPVYKNIGGHAYGTTYSGPIGSVISPHLNDMEDYGHLSYASSLCGNCTEVCPVKINIHEMLLENRHIYVEEKYGGIKEKMAWRMFRHGVMHRQLMNTASGKIKNFVFEKAFRTAWGDRRVSLEFPPKSFNQLWKERNRKK
ncbi:LutB/LldF family L-lactate oxidation iron-sulfur protein [Taibaiella chishuiensis]|uniref:L-lactate dehydrogenase complex protein LldF n=1 Tax=Taibaiella chishuiensis TaxID=1434707 RepID=A0A2P8DCQ7_9BACT|nr:LutB/LldF family L-lactate oxidation iron-sulfur protein [Taibaiella chishuiensis]PSK94989.1 L-lactate dehydrogenase complex protein LldF [Taibaiella chishuiensis]